MMRSAVLGGLVVLLVLTVVGVLAQRADRLEEAAARPSSDNDRTQGDIETKKQFEASIIAKRPLLVAAARDPFTAVAPPPAAPVIDVTPVAPAPPPVPAFPYKVFGRIQEPDGTWRAYLVLDDRLVQVLPGADLQQGFKVDAVSDSEVVVKHGPSGQSIHISWPRE